MKYYVAKNGLSIGPFAVEEIRAKLATGELRPNDPCVSDDGTTNWQPISTRLAGEIPNLPPAPPALGAAAMLSPEVRQKLGFGFSQFIFLQRMLTPTFIQIIYVIGLGVIVLGYLIAILATMFGGGSSPYAEYARYSGPPTIIVLFGLVIAFAVSLILWRIYCEVLIVLFRIHDFLRDIRDAQAPRH